MCNSMCHMKTATVRQVRHEFGKVLEWVAAGEEVTVLKRTHPVARICPPRPAEVADKVKLPDFEARAKAVFGDRVIPNAVVREREERRW